MNAAPARPLGLWTATALVVGNMVGSGTYLLPSSLAPYGGASLYGWAFSAAGAFLLAAVFAGLARRHPRSGGPYAYARAGFGNFGGFVTAWCYWVSIWCGNAAIAVAFAGNFGALVPAATATPLRAAECAIGAIWLCTFFNLAGLRAAGSVQSVTTVLKLLPLVLIAFFGVCWLHADAFTPFNRSGGDTFDVTTTTAALTLWAFLGLECATVPAGHVIDAQRTVPRATWIGTLVATVVTVMSCTLVLALVPAEQLAASAAPFADAARLLGGDSAGYAVAGAAAIACFGALNGWVLMQGQIPLAAARDGLFPPSFAQVDERDTPAFALIISSALASALVYTNYGGSLVQIFTASILISTAATLVPYLMCALAALKLDRAHADGARQRLAASIVGTLAYAFSLWALWGTGYEALLWGCGLFIAGLPIYALRKRALATGDALANRPQA